MYLLDPIGAALSLACTYQYTRNSRYAWPTASFAIMINLWLYAQRGIYGRMLLEALYLTLMIYGWHQWGNQASIPKRPISRLRIKQGLTLTVLALVGTGFFLLLLQEVFHSDIAFIDGACTALSLIAQWMLCRRIIECWILWFVIDVFVIWLEFYRGIPFHAFVHCIYLGLAVSGYLHWSRLLRGGVENVSTSFDH